MKRILIFAMVLPLTAVAQSNLTGIWRLKESENFKGPDYINAIPILINIKQEPDVILLETTSSVGEKDTVISESLYYGKKGINESTTRTGKKKITSFRKNPDDSSWLKQTEIFSKEDPGQLQSVNKERFAVFNNGTMMSLFREYDGSDNPRGNQDFIVEGTYEKVTPEQLAKETATGNGVNFTEGLNWEQLKAKARAENKYIFVDCYATWCRPCRVMDKSVYPLNIVGEAMNDKFISVKVQMDSTKKDPGHVKMLFPLARKLEKEYGITALPSYLFFSPDGKAVHKAIGQQDAKAFIELANKARDPEYQLYTLFNKAKSGELPWAEYPPLADRLKEEFYERGLAMEIAGKYNKEYLNNLSENELLKKQHLDFVGEYPVIVGSSDKVFKLCLTQPYLVDSIKQYEGGGWADGLVKRTITREEVQPLFQEAEKLDKTPAWEQLEQQLTEKYNKELAITYVLDARVDWYEKKQEWASLLQYLRPHLARHDLKKLNAQHLHRCAWYVFKYSEDTSLMKEAVGWMDILIEKASQDAHWMLMDTKAYLTYKMGKRKEGIAIIKKILEMFPQFNYAYEPKLSKMTRGEKIWLTFK